MTNIIPPANRQPVDPPSSLPPTTLADRQAIGAALARQAVADAEQDTQAEEQAANDLMDLSISLGERYGLPEVLEVIGDVRRGIAAWATRREVASHLVGADGL